MVRKTSAAGFVGAGWSASTSFTHTSAPSTPAGRARRVGVDSSTRRSQFCSRVPVSTNTRSLVRGRRLGLDLGFPNGHFETQAWFGCQLTSNGKEQAMNLRSTLLMLFVVLHVMLTASCDGGDTHTTAQPGLVNITVGDEVASFVPWNVSGPHAGKTACPLCVYAQRPGVAIWTNTKGLTDAAKIAAELDRVIEALSPRSAVGYVVLLPDTGATRAQAEASLLAAFAATPLKHVFLTVADRTGNAKDLAKYALGSTTDAATTTIVYVNRTAATIYQNLGKDAESLRPIKPAIERLFDDEEPYREMAVAMCPDDEPGERLEFYGRVLDEHGQPLAKASVIAYNTDATGLYVPRGSTSRTPRLRAVAVTNDDGWYRFKTIKPGPYPDSDDPMHIHLHIDAAVHKHTYRTLWFEGDPRLTSAKRGELDAETVIIRLRKRDDGVWTTRLDVKLKGS